MKSTVDTPNAFSLSSTGDVTVSNGGTQLSVLAKSSFNYAVNVSNNLGIFAIVQITVTLLPVGRPPVVSNQILATPDNIAPNTQLSPALTASHPLGLSLSFSLVDASNTWDVVPATGIVYLRSGQTLNFALVTTYMITVIVTASNLLTAQAFLTINIAATNRPPIFCCGGFLDISVDEGLAAGSLLNGGVAFGASDPNTGVLNTLSYNIFFYVNSLLVLLQI